jgi:SMP-30/Gluconolactonase/LRE-like region
MLSQTRFGVFFAIWLAAGMAQQPPAQSTTPLMACGVHGEIEVLCGARQPEDLEIAPDGKFLIATEYLNQGRGGATSGGMMLFDPAKKTFSKMNVTVKPEKSWGDPMCGGPVGDALISHGSSLKKRRDGKWALYVVNHGSRESIEMFELKRAGGGWALLWHGCEIGKHDYNDVAILPDGGFVGTYPNGLSTPGTAGRGGARGGNDPTGYVARWTPGKGESEVPGTRMRFPNGVVVSADGRYMYVNEFIARVVHKYDLTGGSEVGSVGVDFLPDNLTWTDQGHLLAAGVKGVRGLEAFGVAEIDPEKMQARTIFDSASAEPMISGVSSALKVGDSVYLGAFQGDRIVKIPYKSN